MIGLIINILIIVGMWKIFEKLGEAGWKAIIPIYNMIVLAQALKWTEVWKIVMLFVPVVNIYFVILLMNDLSKRFGKGVGFTVGLILLSFIFIPVLGFGAEPVAEEIAE
ncbi:DUF5684 domain-containing protein [Bacteroides sp. 51]|uniref:DUF5684 domain-containing protein n=1 Tax=Bacteroides sp. 51 TaxID=2302938 RepID=UPI0013D6A28E|nr:DUF5684 domain-containing protein [Bacteroides sp. 51]NDV80423.1 signal peptidase I [Bacteroides sp. 51]